MTTQDESNIIDVDFSAALGERYLAYALSTITSRSLPDVRDGLKPVHRRLLFAMMQLKLDPKSGFKKCARVVGDVIGKYHPHGDTAVYDTMVRLAQNFAVRYPMVDGQGNFGSIDGDNAAAMRYTEARLTDVAIALMQDLNLDTVDFRPTYDGSEVEPVVMPAAFPNLLANGSEGIAVGMATSIPPHNVGEICDALGYLIKHPHAGIEKLVEFIPGPDFPTGGTLVEPHENIVRAYETGKGSFRLRAKWEKEELSHGMYQIVITEIPYQVQKSKLIEKIADLMKLKKLSLLGNIRDESAEDIRVVIDPKSRQVAPDTLMESLYKLTDLEVRISLNMNVISKHGSPGVLSLKEVLQAFLEHRMEVLVRRSNYRLGKIDHRLEVLDGLLIAYLNLDEVIRIIREEDDAKAIMMKKWDLTEVQVEAILNMRLRSLRKLEEIEIRREHKELSDEKAKILELLEDESLRRKYISDEIKEIKNKFGQSTELGKRRTDFADAPVGQVISIEAFIEKEPLTILCSKKGWIKALRGHVEDVSAVKYKEGDSHQFVLKGYTTDKLVIFSSDGKFFTIGCNNLSGGKTFGEPLNLMVDMEQDEKALNMFIYKPEKKYLLASDKGKGFIVKSEDLIAQTKNGKQILNLSDDSHALICTPAEGDHVVTIGKNRKMLIFPLADLPEMKKGQGVALQKYKLGGLSDAKVFKLEEGLTWSLGNRTRTEENLIQWINKRASAGRLPPVGFPRTNKFS
ncbi:MAG: DNA topoisomerase IV subunit A [Rickettsiales bacterium]|nr:DNA topoisomerase IV subunit A [Pseudomonadota bacterium]MDA0965973.1 DNA topoisomerase IV subunit A [Pseudomonadota bacterium]MDG4542556.1 DNA topoisomerase IV subunit A [Rickettsiales bacterium]MDG4545060.1 DNA topoisomerase IV subunit A [Rickettsiales bacterium]MDG4547183.1 DNA topoisomerase IV subunit A [Rickettsiales bacterium]